MRNNFQIVPHRWFFLITPPVIWIIYMNFKLLFFIEKDKRRRNRRKKPDHITLVIEANKNQGPLKLRKI